jgi:TRAP-type mannitol/chloroaromatic compound transport system substrate-binding protein
MRLYPDEVMKTFRANTMETIAELTASDPQSKKIYEAFLDFQKKIVPWMTISEKAFYQNIL